MTDPDDPVLIFRNQDFHKIRDWCLRRGYLFEDPNFKLDNQFEWLRPGQITDNPRLFVGGIARWDIIQGELGDCWMLASIAAIGMHPALVKHCIPSDQSFTSQYAGIFYFLFWQFGKWYQVVIDDRLPTMNGALVYCKSVSDNEYWTALLEKAYCKILGGEYKVADAGNLCEALEDFTGGVVEQFGCAWAPKNFDKLLVKSIERSSLIGCFIDDVPGQYQGELPNGLVRGHSYTVTGAKRVTLPGHGNIVLIRVRNPWGKHEWNGPWSDGSPEWNAVPQSTKQEIGLVYQDEGEFWMSYSDFVGNYQWVDMCHLTPDAFDNAFGGGNNVSTWSVSKIRGSWVRGVSAGGAQYMYMNPQIQFTLNQPDDDNEDGLCSVIIALLQKASGCSGNTLEIGYKVYQMNNPNDVLSKGFFLNNSSVADVPSKGVREVAGRFNFEPGTYCIVPFTYETGKESEFLVRIYSETSAEMGEMDSQIGLSPEDVLAQGGTPPMAIGKKEEAPDEDIDETLKEYFQKVAGEEREMDWLKLKVVLEFAKKESISPSKKDDDGGVAHVIVDAAKYAWNKLFGKPNKTNAFSTVDSFSNDLCRSMVALVDEDHTGKLGLNEFIGLWKKIKKFQKIYQDFSDKQDGKLDSSKLYDALKSAGFKLNRQTLKDIVHRYSSKDGKIPLDDFLHCTIKATAMSKLFKSKENTQSHKAEFSFEEFMDKVMYA